jgi:hypothetical protein
MIMDNNGIKEGIKQGCGSGGEGMWIIGKEWE